MGCFPVAFLTNGLFIVTRVGFELTTPPHESARLTTTPQYHYLNTKTKIIYAKELRKAIIIFYHLFCKFFDFIRQTSSALLLLKLVLLLVTTD